MHLKNSKGHSEQQRSNTHIFQVYNLLDNATLSLTDVGCRKKYQAWISCCGKLIALYGNQSQVFNLTYQTYQSLANTLIRLATILYDETYSY